MGNHPPDASVRKELGFPERYAALRHIASGGMASVWCARDRALRRNVAIKLLAERFADDEEANARFLREARTAARLSGHPNVVMIYDVGETHLDGRAFIVMEFLAGGTVADALRVDSVRRVHAVNWVQEAASALDFAHSRGVLHRDIKPANLLLDRARTLHVADFGIARLGADDTVTGTGQVLGTASYLAPERALGQPATPASDRYSLAVVAFELLVGERPFTARNFAAQARQHVEAAPPAASQLNRSLPESVDAVLARGMAKRPEQRWPTAHDFARALETALTEAATKHHHRIAAAAAAGPPRGPHPTGGRRTAPPTGSHPPVAERRPRRVRSRIPALAALIAGGAAAVAIAGTIGNGGHSPQRSASVLRQASAATRTSAIHAHAPAPVKRPAPKPRTTQTLAVTPAAATTAPPTAETLEARGHALMVAGNYAAALPVLRQAVHTASPGSLTYAYALDDYGRTLLLAGDPKDAVTILYQRLHIPNQTGAVRQQLQTALLALGQKKPHSGGAAAGPPGHRHHRHHRHHRGTGAGPPGAGTGAGPPGAGTGAGPPGAGTGGGPPGAVPGPGPGPQPSQGANSQSNSD